MLDEKKVKLMTRMALYENSKGKEDLKISSYYRKDYASMNVLLSVLWVTIGYAIIVGLAALANYSTLFGRMSMKLAIVLAAGVALGYFVILTVYIVGSSKYYNKKHKDARTDVKKYNHDLTRLLKMYEKENQ